MKQNTITPEAREAICDLLNNFHTLAYPQVLVSEVTGASRMFLSTERKRGRIPAHEIRKQGRSIYTGRGLIIAGLIHRLSWHFGPSAAAAILTDSESHGL